MDTLRISKLEKDNLALQIRNSALEKQIVGLEKKILALENKKPDIKVQDRYEFIKEFGISKSKESGHYFCTSCLMKNIESPLTEKQSGWRCELKDCGKFYKNPSYQSPPKRETSKYFQRSR